MSMPMELRALAALDPKVLRAMNRIFCEEVSGRYQRACGADSQTGAVACVQRFGGSLNMNVHMHNLFLDGGFVEREENRLTSSKRGCRCPRRCMRWWWAFMRAR